MAHLNTFVIHEKSVFLIFHFHQKLKFYKNRFINVMNNLTGSVITLFEVYFGQMQIGVYKEK